jgi:hypothetical protein
MLGSQAFALRAGRFSISCHAIQPWSELVAETKCASCGGTKFEMVLDRSIANASRAMNFIRCAGCGAAVGVTAYEDPGEDIAPLVEAQNAAVLRIDARLTRLEQGLTSAVEILKRLDK